MCPNQHFQPVRPPWHLGTQHGLLLFPESTEPYLAVLNWYFASHIERKPPRERHFLSRALLGAFCNKLTSLPPPPPCEIITWYKSDRPLDQSSLAQVPPSLNDRILPFQQMSKTTGNQAKQERPLISRKYIRFALLW